VGPGLRDCLDALDVAPLFEGKRAFLKINLMKGMPPKRAVNTHPEFVRHLIRYVRAAGGECSVGDSSGVLGFTTEALRASGVWQVAEDEGARPVNLDAGEIVPVEMNGQILERLWTSRDVLDADVFVTVPKLKTHSLMLLTGAVKNQVGLAVGGTKCDLHLIAPTAPRMAEAVVDINLAVKPDLAVVDGVWGLEGGSSATGRRKKAGVIVAGRDGVAVDTGCTAVMGYQRDEVMTNVEGQRRGLGIGSLKDIDVVGRTIEECWSPFERPPFEWKGLSLIGKAVYRVRGHALKPLILPGQCTRCGACVERCPTDAIRMEPAPKVEKAKCIRCFTCRENCTEGAIKLKCPWYLKPLYKKRAAGLALDALA